MSCLRGARAHFEVLCSLVHMHHMKSPPTDMKCIKPQRSGSQQSENWVELEYSAAERNTKLASQKALSTETRFSTYQLLNYRFVTYSTICVLSTRYGMQSRSIIHLQPSDDEVEEEGDDGEQVDEVHGAHEELELAGGTREPDLKQPTAK